MKERGRGERRERGLKESGRGERERIERERFERERKGRERRARKRSCCQVPKLPNPSPPILHLLCPGGREGSIDITVRSISDN